MQSKFKENFWQWIWAIGVAHILVWGPCVMIDFVFCRGKMLHDLFSVVLIESVSIFFIQAKIRQLKKD